LNWGASYVVNDFYKRFVNPNASERQYVVVSQWATVGITLGSIVVSYFFDSISGAWQLLISIGAGTGLVLLLRWYWWRINAWSEVAAMIAALVVSLTLQFGFGKLDDNPEANNAKVLLITVACTTLAWLIATFVTEPESEQTLVNFYRRTRPSLWGWKPIAAKAPDVKPTKDGIWNFVDWISGCAMVYAALFGVGKIIFGETMLGFALLSLAAVSGFVIYWDLNRRGWSTVVD
jgi:Na+/proline symporter